MTKEQYLGLKEELKELASKIKATKPEFKETQRDFSKYQKENGTFNDYYEGRMNSTTWETIRPEYNKLWREQESKRDDIDSLRREFRHKHIVYCFARGRTMKEIEPKVRKGNEPSKHELQRLMKEYDVREPLELEVSA
jgi:hypothetical protein